MTIDTVPRPVKVGDRHPLIQGIELARPDKWWIILSCDPGPFCVVVGGEYCEVSKYVDAFLYFAGRGTSRNVRTKLSYAHKLWRVCNSVTGLGIGEGNTKNEAISDAVRRQLGIGPEARLERDIPWLDTHSLSPRWRIVGSEEE